MGIGVKRFNLNAMESINFNNRNNLYYFNQQIHVNRQKTTVALMFIRQIETGILDFRDELSCNVVSDYMRQCGAEIFEANKCVYASLLGFLEGGSMWNKKLNLYSIKDLDVIKN